MIQRSVRVLGTYYSIEIKKYDEDPDFKEKSLEGWCDDVTKTITLLDMSTAEGWEREKKSRVQATMRETLRHEIVHAFFSESGLEASALTYEGAWCKNEELVDWIGLQGPKLYRAWREAGAL